MWQVCEHAHTWSSQRTNLLFCFSSRSLCPLLIVSTENGGKRNYTQDGCWKILRRPAKFSRHWIIARWQKNSFILSNKKPQGSLMQHKGDNFPYAGSYCYFSRKLYMYICMYCVYVVTRIYMDTSTYARKYTHTHAHAFIYMYRRWFYRTSLTPSDSENGSFILKVHFVKLW